MQRHARPGFILDRLAWRCQSRTPRGFVGAPTCRHWADAALLYGGLQPCLEALVDFLECTADRKNKIWKDFSPEASIFHTDDKDNKLDGMRFAIAGTAVQERLHNPTVLDCNQKLLYSLSAVPRLRTLQRTFTFQHRVPSAQPR